MEQNSIIKDDDEAFYQRTLEKYLPLINEQKNKQYTLQNQNIKYQQNTFSLPSSSDAVTEIQKQNKEQSKNIGRPNILNQQPNKSQTTTLTEDFPIYDVSFTAVNTNRPELQSKTIVVGENSEKYVLNTQIPLNQQTNESYNNLSNTNNNLTNGCPTYRENYSQPEQDFQNLTQKYRVLLQENVALRHNSFLKDEVINKMRDELKDLDRQIAKGKGSGGGNINKNVTIALEQEQNVINLQKELSHIKQQFSMVCHENQTLKSQLQTALLSSQPVLINDMVTYQTQQQIQPECNVPINILQQSQKKQIQQKQRSNSPPDSSRQRENYNYNQSTPPGIIYSQSQINNFANNNSPTILREPNILQNQQAFIYVPSFFPVSSNKQNTSNKKNNNVSQKIPEYMQNTDHVLEDDLQPLLQQNNQVYQQPNSASKQKLSTITPNQSQREASIIELSNKRYLFGSLSQTQPISKTIEENINKPIFQQSQKIIDDLDQHFQNNLEELSFKQINSKKKIFDNSEAFKFANQLNKNLIVVNESNSQNMHPVQQKKFVLKNI